MAGSIRQRHKDSWNLRVFVGWDPVTKKRHYLDRTFRGPRREAEKVLAAMVLEAERLSPSAPRQGTLRALCEEWLAHAAAGYSPRTVETVRRYLDHPIYPVLGDVSVARLTASDLDRFYRRLLAGGAKGGKSYAPATVRRIHGIIRCALVQGVRWGWIASNPAIDASPPRLPHQDLRPPSPQDVARIFSLAWDSDPEFATFILLAASTGARRGELIALRRTDLELDLGCLRIERGIILASGRLVEQGTKTHQVRRVALDARSIVALKEMLDFQDRSAHSRGVEMGRDAFVFTNVADGSAPWRPDSASRSFRVLCERAGVDGIRLHDLRHYVATRLLSSGVDVRTVAGRLGHRSASTTLNVYAHFLPSSDREAADAIGAEFETALGSLDQLRDRVLDDGRS